MNRERAMLVYEAGRDMLLFSAKKSPEQPAAPSSFRPRRVPFSSQPCRRPSPRPQRPPAASARETEHASAHSVLHSDGNYSKTVRECRK